MSLVGRAGLSRAGPMASTALYSTVHGPHHYVLIPHIHPQFYNTRESLYCIQNLQLLFSPERSHFFLYIKKIY